MWYKELYLSMMTTQCIIIRITLDDTDAIDLTEPNTAEEMTSKVNFGHRYRMVLNEIRNLTYLVAKNPKLLS